MKEGRVLREGTSPSPTANTGHRAYSPKEDERTVGHRRAAEGVGPYKRNERRDGLFAGMFQAEPAEGGVNGRFMKRPTDILLRWSIL